MEGKKFQGIPIVTQQVLEAKRQREAYSSEDITYVSKKLSTQEPNLSSYIEGNVKGILSQDVSFVLSHALTAGMGTRRERRSAQNIVLHTIALLAEQANYNEKGVFNDLSLKELFDVFSMREDIFQTLRRERKTEQTYRTERIARMERITNIINPLLSREIAQQSEYGNTWGHFTSSFTPRLRVLQSGYLTTYGMLSAMSMQSEK